MYYCKRQRSLLYRIPTSSSIYIFSGNLHGKRSQFFFSTPTCSNKIYFFAIFLKKSKYGISLWSCTCTSPNPCHFMFVEKVQAERSQFCLFHAHAHTCVFVSQCVRKNWHVAFPFGMCRRNCGRPNMHHKSSLYRNLSMWLQCAISKIQGKLSFAEICIKKTQRQHRGDIEASLQASAKPSI